MYSSYTDAYDLGFDGLKDSGTFLVDSTTAATLAVGDFVTQNGAKSCGFGSAGATILGRVEAIENYSNDDTDGKIATVKRGCTFEDVALSDTTTYWPSSYGDLLAVDGAGKIQKLQALAVDLTNAAVTLKRANCFAIEVDTTNAVATIWLD